MNKKNGKIQEHTLPTRIFGYTVMLAMLVVALLPLVWTVLSSFKADPTAEPGLTWPSEFCFDGYVTVLTKLNISKYFLNSLFCATISVVISTLHISMSSYVVARMQFPGRKLVTTLLMSTLFVPGVALTFPVYRLVSALGIYNTRWALVLIYSCSSIATSFFVIRNYFASIPKELEEAAMLDGCSHVRTFFSVMVPIASPGIAISAVLAFLGYWNEYYWSSLVIIDQDLVTLPSLLAQFQTSFSTNYNGMLSAVVVILLPPVILFCCCSKFFVKAMSGGAVKG